MVEPEPVLRTGSGQKVPAPAGSGSATLLLTRYYDSGQTAKENRL